METADCASNDDDGDGLIDEDVNGWDTDGDGMDDGWEIAFGLDPTDGTGDDGAYGDPDDDGLLNLWGIHQPRMVYQGRIHFPTDPILPTWPGKRNPDRNPLQPSIIAWPRRLRLPDCRGGLG